MRRFLSVIAVATMLLPSLAQASDTYGFGEAAALMFAYIAFFVAHVIGCAVAMIRLRSWRPLLVLPISICFSAVLIYVVGSFKYLATSDQALVLLICAPLIAVPLAVCFYRDLFRERNAGESTNGA